jgi:hypothetical protein
LRFETKLLPAASLASIPSRGCGGTRSWGGRGFEARLGDAVGAAFGGVDGCIDDCADGDAFFKTDAAVCVFPNGEA